MTNVNYYKILRLQTSATPKEIRDGYAKLSVLFDNSKAENAKEIMELVNEAYSVLRNSDSRSVYDLERVTYGNSVEDSSQLSPAEQIVISWGTSYSTEEEQYLEKIHVINRMIKIIIFFGAIFFLWSVVTFRFNISFLIMFGLAFIFLIVKALYRIKNPPPPIEIWANK